MQWIDEYIEQLEIDAAVVINIELPYINTSSSKCLMMLLDKFDDAFQSGKQLKLSWYCDMENESEVECAEEFLEDLTLPTTILHREE